MGSGGRQSVNIHRTGASGCRAAAAVPVVFDGSVAPARAAEPPSLGVLCPAEGSASSPPARPHTRVTAEAVPLPRCLVGDNRVVVSHNGQALLPRSSPAPTLPAPCGAPSPAPRPPAIPLQHRRPPPCHLPGAMCALLPALPFMESLGHLPFFCYYCFPFFFFLFFFVFILNYC